ncbi:hypothetical protein LCGC14_1970100 [marine sediment metagenome]|uniref:Uncharacterized protein n=1 Tax=marine sediment metagenome TaxID=412755 RepID=A0A0F9I903_9ZZZZ
MPVRDESKILFDPKGNLVSSRDLRTPTLWHNRIGKANEYYTLWANKFRVEDLEEAYYGFQWDLDTLPADYIPYVHNMIFVAIDIKSPSLIFQNPIFSLENIPSSEEFDLETAQVSAKLKQDTINYFATADKIGLSASVELAILDAFFRFGVVEVGYSADWIDNPRASKPELAADSDELEKGSGKVLKQPKRIPQAERVYTKYIPSKNFRVGGIDSQDVNTCSWCGYWEWVRTEDILSNKNFDLKGINLSSSSGRSADFVGSVSALADEERLLEQQGDVTRWWKIWDLRSKKKIFYLKETDSIIREKTFTNLPLHILKFRERLRGFYPLPLAFNWISPQVEINETREAARAHRRRFQRKYTYHESAFDEDELEKLENGGDGTFVARKTADPNSITPVPNADLGAQHIQALQISTTDFDNVAGISAQQRLQSTSETATQTKEVSARSNIRDARDVNQSKEFILSIATDVLITVRDKFVNDFWIKIYDANTNDTFGVIQDTLEEWRLLSPEMFGKDDFKLTMDVASLSPIIQDANKSKFIEFISILQSFPFISLSPELVVETAAQVGYKNKRVISVFQQMAQATQLGAQQQSQETGAQPGQIAQREVAQNSPNTTEQIRNQLRNQVV